MRAIALFLDGLTSLLPFDECLPVRVVFAMDQNQGFARGYHQLAAERVGGVEQAGFDLKDFSCLSGIGRNLI